MSARGDSWRAMAAELGNSLEKHASLDCGHERIDAESNAAYCPYCHDYAVWQKWAQREIRALRLDRVRANTTKETSE